MSDARGTRFAFLSLLLVILAIPPASMSGAGPPGPTGIAWTIEVADGTRGTGGLNSIALAPDGSPGISYNAGRDLRYAWRDVDGWHNATVDSLASGGAVDTSLAIDRSGIPHIGYLVWSVGQRIWYAYWNNSLLVWVKEQAGDAGGWLTRTRLSLALDSSGAPHIAYIHTETETLTYASRVGPGAWTSEAVAVVGCCRAVSLRIDARDIPHIAAYNYSLPGLEYYRKEGASWPRETVETTSLIGDNGVSLALNGNDRPRIAYVVGAFPEPLLKFANRTATIWSIRTVPTILDVESYVSLALDPIDQPRIAYTGGEGYYVKYSYRQAGLWQTVVVDTDDVWGYASMAYDPSGVAHIAYFAKRNTVGNLKYARGETVNDIPTSTVQAVAPYWWTTGPLPVQAAASDPDGTVARVDLFYRFDGGGGWGPWSWYGSDPAPPWAWTFPFPGGEGRYEFHSLAFDGTDWEANKTVAEASGGYDATPPASSAQPVVPYLHDAPPAVVNGSASDALSGVADVTLRYAYSSDNATFGPWAAFDTLAAPPWSWTFPLPDGEGYYRFHTVARDAARNAEAGKAVAEAEASYRRPDPPPIAVANASATTASIGEVITFDGTESMDDVGIAAYLWDFGDGATDTNATAAHAYASRGTFPATLTVWDTAGQNDTDVLTIDIQNRPPVAEAGADRTAAKHVPVALDGTGSGDPDGDPLTFTWSQLAGPPVSLTGADTATTTFTPITSGTYSFQLSVDDAWGGTASDAVNVNVPNRPPVADAGPDRTSAKRAAVTLDGTASYDPDGDALTYAWIQEGGPPVVLSDPYAALATFTPVRAGTYGFRLRVADAEDAEAGATVSVQVANRAPLITAADPASSVALIPGESRRFEVTAFDPDGDPLTYAWTLDGLAVGTGGSSYDLASSVGLYRVNVTVSDGELAAWHEWTVRVGAPPPDRNWKPVVAAAFAAVLALAGAWSARRAPWATGSRRRLRAFALTVLPFVLAESATGAVSFFTDLLAIPPLLGVGSGVDASILVAGVAVSVHRVRRWTPPR